MRLVFSKDLPSLFQYICQISLVAIEERVHPTPFRTRKLSSPSPMILHNVMWESRPLPKIVRDPLAAHSARGSFLSPVSASCALAGPGPGFDFWLCPASPCACCRTSVVSRRAERAGDVHHLLHARPAGRRPYGVSLLAPRHDTKDPPLCECC